MKTLRGFLSPWALAALAVWIVVMVLAYNWAVPIYANIGGPGLCPVNTPNCSPETFTVNVPGTAIFAVIAASIVTALLAGVVFLVLRLTGRAPASLHHREREGR